VCTAAVIRRKVQPVRWTHGGNVQINEDNPTEQLIQSLRYPISVVGAKAQDTNKYFFFEHKWLHLSNRSLPTMLLTFRDSDNKTVGPFVYKGSLETTRGFKFEIGPQLHFGYLEGNWEDIKFAAFPRTLPLRKSVEMGYSIAGVGWFRSRYILEMEGEKALIYRTNGLLQIFCRQYSGAFFFQPHVGSPPPLHDQYMYILGIVTVWFMIWVAVITLFFVYFDLM